MFSIERITTENPFTLIKVCAQDSNMKGDDPLPTTQEEADELQDRIEQAEEKIIANLKVCPVSNVGNLDELNAKLLESKLSDDFYSASLLQALTCYFDVTLHAAKDKGELTVTREVHKYLTKPHRIGAESVEGVALLTGIKGLDDLVIIKAPRKPEADGLLHEYFVGSTCLNDLRKRIPSFMYTFGAFRCSAPVLEDKKVIQWCTPKTPHVNYVIFEKIIGKDLESLMPNLTLDEFMSYFIQIALGEQVAVEACSWTHSDLHAGNVLCREVSHIADGSTETEFNPELWYHVPYQLAGGKTLYIKSNRVPTFIDYGRSHVKYKGLHYGFIDFGFMREDGLFPNEARPLADLYKLLGFCLYSLFNETKNSFTPKSPKARELFRQLQPLFSFFRDTETDGEPDYVKYLSIVKDERDTFYVYSSTIEEWEKESSIQDLLAHIEQNYPDQWRRSVSTSVGPEDLVLSCHGVLPDKEEENASCDSPKQAVESIGFKLVKGKHHAVASKHPESVVQEVSNTRKRVKNMQNMRSSDALESSIEYKDALESNTRSEKLLRENYPKLRKELHDRIADLVNQLKVEAETYNGLKYKHIKHESAADNDKQLNKLIQAMEKSHLTLIFALVKAYVADEMTLSQLEFLAKEKTPTKKRAFLPKELDSLSRRIVEEAKKVEEYLDDLQPLTQEGKVLKTGLLDTINLGN